MQIVDQFDLGDFVEIETVNGNYYRGKVLSRCGDESKMWHGWLEICYADPSCKEIESWTINVEHIVAYRIISEVENKGDEEIEINIK